MRNEKTVRIFSLFILWIGFSCNLTTASDNSSAQTSDSASERHQANLMKAHLQGLIRAKNNAILRPTSQGTITQVHVTEGQWVTAGAPLMTIDDATAKAAVEVARQMAISDAAIEQAAVAVQQAQNQLTRTRIALHANASSEFELQAKELQLESARAEHRLRVDQQRQARAQLALAEEQLRQRTLFAPFDGQVVQIHVGVGNTVDSTQPAVQVVQLDQLEVEMHLPITYLNKVTRQQVYKLVTADPKPISVEALASHVSPIIEPTSNTFRVVFSIDNQQNTLPVGLEVYFDHQAFAASSPER